MKINRLITWFLIVVSAGVLQIGDSFGQETKTDTPEAHNPIFAIRDSVLSYFYPVSGVITGMEQGLVKADFKSAQGLKKGMRFSVFREGRPFYHPITKEPIGRSEEFAGRIEIHKVLGGLYLCRVVAGSPKIGDIVRITSSRIKLAFFQNKQADWALSEVFYNSLKESGRFDFLESYTKTYDPQELSMVARKLGAEAVLLFSTQVKKENMFLGVKLFWAEDGTSFAEMEVVVEAGLVKELMSEDKLISMGPVEGEPWGSYELAGGELIAMGDVDGNGERELIVSDGNSIRVYSYKQEPREIWFIKGIPDERHLSIDVLDINQNGRAEIFVTSVRKESIMSSFVLEYDPSEGYRKIVDKSPYAMRIVGKTLLMQAFTSSKTFTGHVYEAVWREGQYKIDKPLKLPEEMDIYGFTYVDWSETRPEQNKGHPNLLVFDNDGYLNLYDENELIWRSKDSYGRFDISFKKTTYSVVNPEEKWFVKGRLVTVKTERGQEVIVIKKIPHMSNVPGLGYKKAEVYSLWWDGEVMNDALILSGVSGAVTDHWVEGDNLLIIARTGLTTFLTKMLYGDFLKGSILYYYNLKGK